MTQPADTATNNQSSEDTKIKEQSIFDNYATPLVGQFLNLPKEPVEITCPACHIRAPSDVVNDLKWYNGTVNGIYSFLFVGNNDVMTSFPCETVGELRHFENHASPTGEVGRKSILLCCCCFWRSFSHPCRDTDKNHYCKNCGCYFGRVMKPKKYLKNSK